MTPTTTLDSAPLAPLLQTMFADAEAPPSESLNAALEQIPLDERRAMSASPTRYKEFYGLAKDASLAVSRETAQLLYMLVRATGATSIVEFGTSFGVSTLHLAAALRDNGQGGRVITTEFEPSKAAKAREHFVTAGLDDLVELREGDALETLAAGLPERIELVLLDGAKGLYPPVLELLEARLGPGAVVVADDAERSPGYLARVRAGDGGWMSQPFGGDVELSVRTR